MDGRNKSKYDIYIIAINLGFEKMKHNPQGITTSMQLYFSGESLRNIARSLKLLGMEVSHQTIYNWIDKYTSLMEKYLEKITPKVSTACRTDELYLKIKCKTNTFTLSWMMKLHSGLPYRCQQQEHRM